MTVKEEEEMPEVKITGDTIHIRLPEREVHIDREKVLLDLNGFENIKAYLKKWQSFYGHQNWAIGDVPKDADAFVQLEVFYDNSRKAIEQLYNEVVDKANFVNMFNLLFVETIKTIEREMLVSYREDKMLLESEKKVWSDLQDFLIKFHHMQQAIELNKAIMGLKDFRD